MKKLLPFIHHTTELVFVTVPKYVFHIDYTSGEHLRILKYFPIASVDRENSGDQKDMAFVLKGKKY